MWIFLFALSAEAKKPAPVPLPPPIERVAADLIGPALVEDAAWEDVVWLSDRIGARPNGSPALEAALQWGSERFLHYGLVNVRRDPVTVPVWHRGELSISANGQPVHGLSLGSSIGTLAAGLDADVFVVSSWEDFEAHKDQVKGRIVVWDAPYVDYGTTVKYRYAGASAASRAGAVASLVRSISPTSLSTPHTGTQRYDADVTPIPAIAITLEDATWLHRLQDRGVTPRMHIQSTAAMGEPAPSSNVLGEVTGRELPNEIVVIGCHIDSWDVGHGAQDDAAGCVQAMHAVRLIQALPYRPRRTIRLVFFTSEEFGTAGSKAYDTAHGAEKHFAAIETDTGSGQPLGIHVAMHLTGAEEGAEERDQTAAEKLSADLAYLEPLLAPLGAGEVSAGYAGTDIEPLIDRGVPGFGLYQDLSGYWPIHHTPADTIDKIDRVLLDKNVAVLAVTTWALADSAEPLVRP